MIRARTLVVAALVAAASVPVARSARAQDLVTDPNAPPPPPPPLPPPGTTGSTAPPPAPGSTAATLQQSSEEDTGVGLHFVYLQPEIGVGWATLGSVIPNSDYRSGAGPVFGVGLGLEFISFQAGGRFRLLSTPNFNLATVGGELSYQPGSGRFWPRIGLAAGYAWGAKWPVESCSTSCGVLDVNGIDLGARAGFQYYVTGRIEIGLDLGLDALFLKRRGINGGPIRELASDESSTGFMAVGMFHVGFHYP